MMEGGSNYAAAHQNKPAAPLPPKPPSGRPPLGARYLD